MILISRWNTTWLLTIKSAPAVTAPQRIDTPGKSRLAVAWNATCHECRHNPIWLSPITGSECSILKIHYDREDSLGILRGRNTNWDNKASGLPSRALVGHPELKYLEHP